LVKFQIVTLFAWLISHQPAVLFSQNRPATRNQSAVLFSQNKPAPAISHQPNEPAQFDLEEIKVDIFCGMERVFCKRKSISSLCVGRQWLSRSV
jgi:hypothetical protein